MNRTIKEDFKIMRRASVCDSDNSEPNHVTGDKGFDTTEIICIGHMQKQLDSISDRSFIKKINLNDLDVKYSSNDWSESRAFMVNKPLYSKNAEYVGFVTASWNDKFSKKIENFNRWKLSKTLVNSEPGLVLTSHDSCLCNWDIGISWIGLSNKVLDLIEYEFGMKQIHRKTVISNQIISHVSVIEQYINHLKNEKIFDKIHSLTNQLIELRNLKKQKIERSYGYLFEMYSSYWFAHQKQLKVVGCSKINPEWYSKKEFNQRRDAYLTSNEYKL